jgi:hypothetical protein
MLAAAKYIGAGVACSGLIGAGAGIGTVFKQNPKKFFILFILFLILLLCSFSYLLLSNEQ